MKVRQKTTPTIELESQGASHRRGVLHIEEVEVPFTAARLNAAADGQLPNTICSALQSKTRNSARSSNFTSTRAPI